MTMLPRKQQCLARNRLGMLCHCQALSSGRCHFHNPLLTENAGVAARIGGTASTMSTFLTTLPERLVPARAHRQTPVAFALRASAA